MTRFTTRRGLLVACAWAAFSAPGWAQPSAGAPEPAPALMLAGSYRPGLHLADFWVSEKLDGVRGRWTGSQLVTRGGLAIAAPGWFTAGWPKVPMDGELWAGRGRFEEAVSTVRRETPDDAAWQRLRFMVFDLPEHGGTFDERVAAMEQLAQQHGQPWLQAVPQRRVADEQALMALLRQTERLGGEGLMLHLGSARYAAGRSSDIVKLKSHDDAEALVLGHEPGQGKYAGMVGALRVQTPEGRRFKLGSGLSDEQRRQPPPIGAWVTYRYRGLTDSGLPRFATFVRVRADLALNGPQPAR